MVPHWLIPAGPSDFAGTIAGSRRYPPSSLEGPLVVHERHSLDWFKVLRGGRPTAAVWYNTAVVFVSVVSIVSVADIPLCVLSSLSLSISLFDIVFVTGVIGIVMRIVIVIAIIFDIVIVSALSVYRYDHCHSYRFILSFSISLSVPALSVHRFAYCHHYRYQCYRHRYAYCQRFRSHFRYR